MTLNGGFDPSHLDQVVRRRYKAKDEAIRVPVVNDFTSELVRDDAAHEISAEAFVGRCFGQLWATTFSSFQFEFVVDQ
jgi:hypothetical protein